MKKESFNPINNSWCEIGIGFSIMYINKESIKLSNFFLASFQSDPLQKTLFIIESIIILLKKILNEAREKSDNLIDSLLMYIMQKPIPISHQELFMGLKLSFSPFYFVSYIIYFMFKIDLSKLHLNFPLKQECQEISFIAHWNILL